MPRKAKSPAFSIYVNDWLGSTSIQLMTPAQEGAYFRLLCHAWSDPHCSLPDDDHALAVLSRLGDEWHNGASVLIRKCFETHPKVENRIHNLRLSEERKTQRKRARIAKANGLKSWGDGSSRGSKRGCKTSAKRTAKASANCEQNDCLSSSSSSSSSKEIPNGISNPPLPPELDTPEFLAAWQQWVDVRIEIKKPLKATGAKACIKKLLGWAIEGGVALAIESLDNSSAGGWQGLFDPRERRGGSANGKALGGIDPRALE